MNIEINKHNRLINGNKKELYRVESVYMLACDNGLEDEFKDKYECRVGFIKAYIKHSEYMIRLFTCFSEENYKET